MSKEVDEKAQELVRQAGKVFVVDLKQARGNRPLREQVSAQNTAK
jgi:hypothetical protein